jgi:hypothetical protein
MSDSTSTVGAMALYTVHGEHGEAPSLASAATQLGVSLEVLDAAFGVVPIDPQAGLYAVQARSDRVQVAPDGGHRYPGPYSSPPIAPFCPPRKADEDE